MPVLQGSYRWIDWCKNWLIVYLFDISIDADTITEHNGDAEPVGSSLGQSMVSSIVSNLKVMM